MIVFNGELSENNKKFLKRKMKNVSIFSTCILSIILVIPITLAVVFDDIIWAIAYIIIPALILFSVVPIPKKKWNTICPTEISINDETVIIHGETFHQEREISQLKRIIDFGDCYKMEFVFPHKSFSCLCQKNLIVKGTLEEFEERFADIIVRKAKR
mgnify:CR=1 FL=1